MKTNPTSLYKLLFGIAIALLCAYSAYAQSTQTIRGKILDDVTQTPLIGVTVFVDGNVALGSTTDEFGDYRIEKVPVGRQNLKVTYVGYEEQTIPNVIVTAGKEVILNFRLVEKVSVLNEVVITADKKKIKRPPTMSLQLSARGHSTWTTRNVTQARWAIRRGWQQITLALLVEMTHGMTSSSEAIHLPGCCGSSKD